MIRQRWASITVLTWILAGTQLIQAGTPRYRTIALIGQAALEDPNVVFASLQSPSIGNRGEIAFAANVKGTGVNRSNNFGVWIASDDLRPFLRKGDRAPEIPDKVMISDLPVSLLALSRGDTVLSVQLTGQRTNSSNDQALYVGNSAELKLVARKGMASPLAGFNYDVFPETIAINDEARVAFWTRLRDPAGTPVKAVLTGQAGALDVIAAEGQATGIPGSTFAGFRDPVMNRFGQVAFRADLAGDQIDVSNRWAIFRKSETGLEVVAQTGTPIPGQPDDVVLRDETFTMLPRINSQGQILFQARIRGRDRGTAIFQGEPGDLSIVAEQGQFAPGMEDGVTFALFDEEPLSPLMNDRGQIVFKAVTDADGASNAGIWAGGAGELELVAREGQRVPGIPENRWFGDASGRSPFGEIAVNGVGQIAFTSVISGEVTNPNTGETQLENLGVALFATDLAGNIHVVAQPYTALEIADGDRREVRQVSFISGADGSDGWPSAFNAYGEVAFALSFTDSGAGIFSARVPAFERAGDFNMSGELDLDDLRRLSSAVWQDDDLAIYDLNEDGTTDGDDMSFWIHELKNTAVGDSNLDGRFDSQDLADVLIASQYEDRIASNSTWSTGDWNFDREFDSDDFIAAFSAGAYERQTVVAVPESYSLSWGLWASCWLFRKARLRGRLDR